MTEKQQPIDKLHDGQVSAAIWKQTGESGDFYNFTIDRVYTDKEGNSASSSSFSRTNALQIAHLMTKVNDRINELTKTS